ncbi:MAG: prepilin peptidase [Enterococcus sp.]
MFWIFCIGTSVGSFCCLFAQRFPQGLPIIFAHSRCSSCHRRLHWFELIPIVSWILQKQTCRSCKQKLTCIYPLSECTAGLFACWVWLHRFDTQIILVSVWIISAYLLALIDSFYFIVELKVLCIATSILWYQQLSENQFHWETIVFTLGIILCCHYLVPKSIGSGDYFVLLAWSGGLTIFQLNHLLLIASGSGLCWMFGTFLTGKFARKIPFIPFLFLGLVFTLLY